MSTRVAVIIHAPVWGGLHNLLAQIAGPARDKDVEFIAFVPDSAPRVVERLQGLEVEVVAVRLGRLRKSMHPRIQLRFLRNLPAEISALRQALRTENVDVVISSGIFHFHGWIAALLERLPFILQINSVAMPPGGRLLARLRVRTAKLIMVEGTAPFQYFPALRHSEKNIISFVPTVDFAAVASGSAFRDRMRRNLGIQPQEILVGTVGNRGWQKRHDHLVRVVATLVDEGLPVRLLVLGSVLESNKSRYDKEVIELARHLGLFDRGVAVFAEPRDPVPNYLSAMDVFVLSSVTEGVPNSMLEAMAAGVACVSYDVGSVGVAIAESGVHGMRVDSGDMRALTDALRKVVTDGVLRERLRTSGANRAQENFSLEQCVAAHVTAVKAVVGHESRAN